MRHRTLFISDVHLGTPVCKADMLLDFRTHPPADTIYLVGDILDAWRLRRGWFWPQSHNDVVQQLLSRAHDGARIVYIPGNHDDVLRNCLGTHFGGVEVMHSAVHVTADGRRVLVTHGDSSTRSWFTANGSPMSGSAPMSLRCGSTLGRTGPS